MLVSSFLSWLMLICFRWMSSVLELLLKNVLGFEVISVVLF